VHDILGLIYHLQATNRGILNRLRPMALGHVPLQDILSELVHERERQHPQIAFSFVSDKLMRSYGDSIDLTIYRCIQESLTNVIRHAQARHVAIELGAIAGNGSARADAAALALTVRDDGRGIAPKASMGFGIPGMQERVQALGGDAIINSAPDRGTCVRIVIPMRQRPDGSEPHIAGSAP